jgi:hypothetical protein
VKVFALSPYSLKTAKNDAIQAAKNTVYSKQNMLSHKNEQNIFHRGALTFSFHYQLPGR